MNNILKFCFMLFLGATVVSCSETDVEESTVTFLPKLTVTGASDVVLDCATTSFTDPGIKAEEGGQEIAVVTNVQASYFGDNVIDSPDLYNINYSAENVDGIPGSAFRTVLIPPCNGDLVSSLEGIYTCTVARNGVIPSAAYENVEYIMVIEISPGVYQLSDAMGGWYEFGRGLGTAYGSPGMTVQANDIPANDFTFPNTVICNTFDGVVEMTDFVVDPANRQIVYTTYWEYGFEFVATMTQVDL